MRHFLAPLACLATLAGCAQQVPHPASLIGEQHRCRLPVVKLSANEYDNSDEGAGRTYNSTPDTGGSLISALARNSSEHGGAATDVLVLSGGSLHGAFGAGFFYGWMYAQQPGDESLPRYRIITGVSTGALQSTFVFLATSEPAAVTHDPNDAGEDLRTIAYLNRRWDAVTNDVTGPGTSYLANLAQLYMPDRESDLLTLRPLQRRSPNKLGMLALINHPAVATMDPLRRIIAAQMGDATLKRVAGEADRGRKLYVALADLNNGYGYAADLTRLAQLAVYAGSDKDDVADQGFAFPESHGAADRLIAARRCYTDALVASSTVPPGVPAVSIGIIREKRDGHLASPNPRKAGEPRPEISSDRAAANHLFIDGGAGFAVFFSQLKDHLPNLPNVNMDLIVNGDYFPGDWEKMTILDRDKADRWDMNRIASTDVIERSADLLQTQVRLFSVQEARRWTNGRGRFRWAFIDDRYIIPHFGSADEMRPWPGRADRTPQDWEYTRPGDVTGKTCREWHKEDERAYNPMEFFPTYMRCILSYGMSRGRNPARRWNLIEPGVTSAVSPAPH